MAGGITFQSQGAAAYSGIPVPGGGSGVRSYSEVNHLAIPPSGTVLSDGPITPHGFEYGATGRGHLWIGPGAGGGVYYINPNDGGNDEGIADQAFPPGTRTLVKGSVSIFDTTPLDSWQNRLAVALLLDGSGSKDEDNIGEMSEAERPDATMGFLVGHTVSPLDDSSGNGRHLVRGSSSNALAQSYDQARFGQGWYMPVGRNHSTNLAYLLPNGTSFPNFAVVTSFDFDGLDAGTGALFAITSGSFGSSTLAYLEIKSNGTLFYSQDGPSTTFYSVSSVATVSLGPHTVTCVRNFAARSIVVKLDGVTVINGTWAPSLDPPVTSSTGSHSFTWAGGNGFVGTINEGRLWGLNGGVIPSQATLDAVIDPNNNTYRNVAEGNESALWFMDGDPATATFQKFNAPTGTPAALTESGHLAGLFIAFEVEVEMPYDAVDWTDAFVTMRVTDSNGVERTLFDRVNPASTGQGHITEANLFLWTNALMLVENLHGRVVQL